MTPDDSWLRNREAYPCLIDMPVRYGDIDMNGHVNNAVYASYFENGRTELFADKSRWPPLPHSGWVLARIVINFVKEVHYPSIVTIATGIARVGKSSVLHYQAVFDGEACAALGETTIVQINAESRKPMPLAETQRAALSQLLMRHRA